MKARIFPLFILLCGLPTAVRADFRSSQRADLSLGRLSPEQSFSFPAGVAVDPATHKVFVADLDWNRVLRFSSAESLTNGGTAEAVIGQPDMDSSGPGTTAERLRGPRGLWVDADGRLWVADTGNHRVLRFDHAATIPAGFSADAVFGQPGFTSAITGVAANLMNAPRGVTVAADGTVWVADTGNNRVLRFAGFPPVAAGFTANTVLGQPDFSAANAATTQTGMKNPAAVTVENQNPRDGNVTLRLWVADAGNSRVLRFDLPSTLASGAPASRVLGQSGYTTGTASLTASGMFSPQGLAIAAGGLWAVDEGYHRATLFRNAASKASGAPADLVLGQPDFITAEPVSATGRLNVPRGVATDGTTLWIADSVSHRVVRHVINGFTGKGAHESSQLGSSPAGASNFGPALTGMAIDPISAKLFVCDANNNRVLRFASVRSLATGDPAEAVFGQPDFDSTSFGATPSRMRSPRTPVIDYFGHLWVTDSGNNRVLRFDNAAAAPSGSAAAQVLGQGNFTAAGGGTSSTAMRTPEGLALEFASSLGNAPPVSRLWVSDAFNHRVLRFDQPLSMANGAAASGVLGQAGFNTSFAATLPQPDGLNFPSGLCAAAGRLWVADESNNRVLRFDSAALKPNGGSADGVLLQSDFTSSLPGNTQTRGRSPEGLTLSASGRLFVADRDNCRVLWFDNAASRPNGAAANGVFGQPNFNVTNCSFGWLSLYSPQACLLDPATGRLWVGDSANRRALRFSPALESTLTGLTVNAGNTATIHIHGRVGERLEIRSSTDLLTWNTVEHTLTPASQFLPFLDLTWTGPVAGPRKFYRLQLP